MVDALQTFSPGNLTGVLGTVLISWLVWPIVCGLLGAHRGLGLRGAMHGLFWGPIGLPIVLLSRVKHRCPTCGQRTLTKAADRTPPHALVLPSVRPPQDAPEPMKEAAPPPLALPCSTVPTPEPQRQQVPEKASIGDAKDEQARLLAWVNTA